MKYRIPDVLQGPARMAPALLLGALLACGGAIDDDDSSPAAPYSMEALLGDGGVALFIDPVPTGDLSVEATTASGVTYDVPLTGATATIDIDGAAATSYTLLDGVEAMAGCTPIAPTMTMTSTPHPAVLLAGGTLGLEASIDGGGLTLARADLLVRRRLLPSGETSYLDPACLGAEALEHSCWLAAPTALLADAPIADIESLALPAHAPLTDGPQVEEIGCWLHVDEGDGVYAGASMRAAFLGASLIWGDPHAHSNLSHDGCEEDVTCEDRGAIPGEDFFGNAVGAGLDFAAITEHAEWQHLVKNGDQSFVVWDEILARVEDALVYEDDGFVPLLGYEWTNYVNPFEVLEEGELAVDHPEAFNRGHKTVLFHATDVCERFRVGAETMVDVIVKMDSGLVYSQDEDRPLATTFDQLEDQLAEAGDECGEEEYVTFYHHPAMKFPSPVNWSLAVNEPNPQGEMLVGIAGEHGSSECLDPGQEGCDFWITDDPINEYLWWGSVQHALSLGYRLGFIGDTDSHDGKPGTLDEPSTIAVPVDTDGDGIPDGIDRQMTPGALTGVWVDPEADPRDALWDGLRTRRTLATTGPRCPIAAVALESDGTPHLPGSVIPVKRFPLALTVVIDSCDDYEVEVIEVVDPADGAVIAEAEGTLLTADLPLPDSPALYVRIRAWQDDTEHRVWLSPFFVGQ